MFKFCLFMLLTNELEDTGAGSSMTCIDLVVFISIFDLTTSEEVKF